MILSIATSQTIELQHKVVTDGVCFLSIVYVSQRDVIDNETIISQYYLTPNVTENANLHSHFIFVGIIRHTLIVRWHTFTFLT
jgi:hypothetical protein